MKKTIRLDVTSREAFLFLTAEGSLFLTHARNIRIRISTSALCGNYGNTAIYFIEKN